MRFTLIEGPLVDRSEKRGALYGSTTCHDLLIHQLKEHALKYDVEIDNFSSFVEGDIIRYIAELEDVDGIMINPGAYTHTSVGIRDALSMQALPFIEFHLSNIFARESFRHSSYLSDIASGVIVGLGEDSYVSVFFALLNLVKKRWNR